MSSTDSPIILCPLDFSQTALNAINFGAMIAKVWGGRLALLAVQTGSDVSNPNIEDPFNTKDNVETLKMQELLEMKKKILEQSQFANIEVLCVTRFGKFREQVVKLAQYVDMIVMGTKGGGTVKGMFLGSNTSYVLGHVNVPVLIVPPEAKSDNIEQHFKSIAFASEFSKEQIIEQEVHEVVGFAEPFNSDVTFVHVEKEFLELCKPQVVVSGSGSLVFPPKFDTDDVREMAKQKGRRLKKQITKVTDYKNRHFVVLSIEKSDNVQEALADYLERHNVGMLAMVRRRRGVLESIFHTSVTKKLALHSHVPLLIFKE